MKIQSNSTAAVLPLNAPETSVPPTLSASLKQAIAAEIFAQFSPALHPHQRGSLLDSFKQAIHAEINTHLPVAMYNQDKAVGAAMTFGGAVMQGLGKRLGSAGVMGAKVLGAGMVFGGKVAEEQGKNTYGNAGSSNNSGGYNAYSGFYTGSSITGKK
ncbi:hypothetical protein [Pseudomonas sp. AF03-9]|uniref:hypothetical protein n=1 Tax=Pseudomonas sp. AF03-9 TaxID=2849867 RepID=UPI001CFA9109|nr:hypothetical protein [Pseudomonas sp. AF03-9]